MTEKNLARTLISQTPEMVGQTVRLLGFVDTKRDHGKITFIDLRDKSGLVQCVGYKMMGEITTESVLEIVGEVKARPEKMVNTELTTGKVEIDVKSYEILSSAGELPLGMDGEGYEIGDEVRLKYRYLDLRRPRLQKNLRLRAKFARAMRNELAEEDFVEIETPLLTRATKEGSRDFVVPSRLNPGEFYALPQSPQQYKQLLMTAGFERYFQFARCIRDEDPRADRGFEHTQIDMEMSYLSEREIMALVEKMIKTAITAVGGKLRGGPEADFPIFTYAEAMKKFGADKFDLRTEEEKKAGILAFAWVVDFPFFKKVDTDDAAEKRDGKSGWTFTHNPFSMPQEKYLADHLAGKNIEQILTAQYDLVCNGYEAGGGSVRAHRPEILAATFRIMGYNDEEIEENVGHMLRAFAIGTPPHGGIALGLDRLAMVLAGESSMKEVIAFPMTGSGHTAVMDAPQKITSEQLSELQIEVKKSKKQ